MSVAHTHWIGGQIAFSLGSLGAGGSILVVAALIYGLAVGPKDVAVQALVIVDVPGTTPERRNRAAHWVPPTWMTSVKSPSIAGGRWYARE
ncbi:MAG: hypothetical protein IH987_10680 [Planctomycetes bacterium]|nr:hypothetical protein [Planctomycetota bacterium]